MTRSFRVLDGKHAGQIVDETDVCECDRCEGSGEIRGSYGGDGYGDRCSGWNDWEADCPDCGGPGVVLGYPGECGGLPPVRVVEVTSVCRQGEAGPAKRTPECEPQPHPLPAFRSPSVEVSR